MAVKTSQEMAYSHDGDAISEEMTPMTSTTLSVSESINRDTSQMAEEFCQTTVLLIDDQVIIGEALRRLLLSEEDISFHYCSDPFQAVQQALNITPTVILLDLVMPAMSGLALLRLLRSHAATHDVPIILLSSVEDSASKAEAFAEGANDYLVKFPDAVELIARIRYHSKAYVNLRARADAIAAQRHAKELEQTLQELRITQSQLIQAEKLSSLGQMVAGIAHEINNPVSFIYGNLDYINDYTNDLLELINLYQKEYSQPTGAIQSKINEIDLNFLSEDLPKTIASMRVGSERIREIVLSLRNFARQDEVQTYPTDIHEGINSTLLILNHRIKKRIEIIKRFDVLPLVECYPSQLNQVFMNLIGNAIDALEESSHASSEYLLDQIGTITITTEAHPTSAIIRIADNGPGISEVDQQKLFDPFFTTKPIGKGTGLGLSISHQIITQKHKGQLRCISTLGKGTEFVIEIPLSEK